MTKARLALFALALVTALPLAAQDATSEPIPDLKISKNPQVSTPLFAPRHIFIDDTGMYIVEAGRGGEVPAESPLGAAMTGGTGQVTHIKPDGTTEPFITGLFSTLSETGEVTGAHAFYKNDEAAWVLVGQGVLDAPPETPAWSLMQYSADGTTLEKTIDLLSYEESANPDEGAIDSNPTDLVVAPDGTIYVVDAAANDILKIVGDEISTFATWKAIEDEPQTVPTSIELDAEGNMYVGFLTGFPFPVGGAWIEVLNPNGELIRRYDGLTMVVDIDLSNDGTLYAVEFGQFTEEGPIPGSGRVMKVTEEGVEPVVSGLSFPYGMAVLDDGSFAIANSTSFTPSGQLIYAHEGDVFDMPVAMPEAAATAEATE
jgi:hypothetical protein